MSEAQKFDVDKPPLGLLSRIALEETAQVLAFGAYKYGRDNWRGGVNWQRYIDAALRHIMAFAEGEDLDPESGLSHMAHAACCIMFLLEYAKTHPEFDNRYKVYTSTEEDTDGTQD
ncbi:hypothetical protein LCGC14_0364400 [marine sediment metagenome]|uniref:dATP/dGTP diphosphohydrolase N-terminal domain-containing protein n=1 Tax=marine sediment metagenome TaxID=412755 RepID=A0A0F9TD15_9ZZZZ